MKHLIDILAFCLVTIGITGYLLGMPIVPDRVVWAAAFMIPAVCWLGTRAMTNDS